MSCPVEYNHIFNVSGSFAVANKWIINCTNSSNNKSEHDDKCTLNAGNCTHCGLGLCVCVPDLLRASQSARIWQAATKTKSEWNDKHTRPTTVPVPVPAPFWVPLPLHSTEHTYFDNKSSSVCLSGNRVIDSIFRPLLNSGSTPSQVFICGTRVDSPLQPFSALSAVFHRWLVRGGDQEWHCDCLISRLAA